MPDTFSNKNPTFSVIIPVFNGASTIRRAIESVINQSYRAFEIIVVDDGSTDETAAIVRGFGSRINYIYQPNSGVAVARNSGVSAATGSWITFLDADDAYAVDRIKLHAEWIIDDSHLDFLLADQEARCPNAEKITQSFFSACKAGQFLRKKWGEAHRIVVERCDFKHMIADGFNEIRTLTLPRQTFHEVGGFPVGVKIGEDTHFFIRLYMTSRRIGVVPVVLATYYIYQESALRKDRTRALELYVQTLVSLVPFLGSAHPEIREGFDELLRIGRLSLAYGYLRIGRRLSAVKSVVPSFLVDPNLLTLRDIFSVCKGFSKQT